MDTIGLLKKIINKGGIVGSSGRLYLGNEMLAAQFIIECSKQLHAESVRALWGTQLMKEINSFKVAKGY